jgi:hypothetical protein
VHQLHASWLCTAWRYACASVTVRACQQPGASYWWLYLLVMLLQRIEQADQRLRNTARGVSKGGVMTGGVMKISPQEGSPK